MFSNYWSFSNLIYHQKQIKNIQIFKTFYFHFKQITKEHFHPSENDIQTTFGTVKNKVDKIVNIFSTLFFNFVFFLILCMILKDNCSLTRKLLFQWRCLRTLSERSALGREIISFYLMSASIFRNA